MLENKHNVTMRLHGPNARLCASDDFRDLILGELGSTAFKERTALLKQLRRITNLFKANWVGTTVVTNDNDGYSEAYSYHHESDVADEITILLTYGRGVPMDTPMQYLDDYDFIEDAKMYLRGMEDKHTTALCEVYLDTMKDLVKHYGNQSKIFRSLNRLTHAFVITPAQSSKNRFHLQVILVPRRRDRNPQVASHIQ